jgi:hypothetical protein
MFLDAGRGEKLIARGEDEKTQESGKQPADDFSALGPPLL